MVTEANGKQRTFFPGIALLDDHDLLRRKVYNLLGKYLQRHFPQLESTKASYSQTPFTRRGKRLHIHIDPVITNPDKPNSLL